jgi:hypothetical protein
LPDDILLACQNLGLPTFCPASLLPYQTAGRSLLAYQRYGLPV